MRQHKNNDFMNDEILKMQQQKASKSWWWNEEKTMERVETTILESEKKQKIYTSLNIKAVTYLGGTYSWEVLI